MDNRPKLWELLRDRVPIDRVAARYARDGYIRPSGQGWMCRCLCGGHSDRRASVKLWNDGHAHCYACGQHCHDVIALYQFANRLSDRWQACLQMRDEYLGMGVEYDIGHPLDQGQRRSMNMAPEPQDMPLWARTLLSIALAHYQSKLESATDVLAYLRNERGLTETTIHRMRIGFSDGAGLKLALYRSKTLSTWGGKTVISRAEELGLFTEHGEFLRERIIFPVLSDGGEPIFLIGRATKVWQADTKYLNMANSEYVVRKPMLWGQAHQGAIVVEGPMDAAALLQWGLDQEFLIVCLLGVGFDAVMSLLTAACLGKPVFLALDQDNAGKRAALKHAAVLNARGLSCSVMVDRDRYDAARKTVRDLSSTPSAKLTDAQLDEMQSAQQHLPLVKELLKLGIVKGVNWGGAKDHAEMLPLEEAGQRHFREGLKTLMPSESVHKKEDPHEQ